MRNAVRLPRVLADEDGDLGVLEVAAHDRAEHARVDEELARLLLREGAGAIDGTEGAQRCAAVAATEVVALSAAAVVQDAVATVVVAHCGELRRDLADRGLPIDLLERAVGAPPQWRQQPLCAVLIVVEP